MAVQQPITASIFDIRLPATPVALVTLATLAAVLTIVPTAKAQTFQVLYNFSGGADGFAPNGLAMDRFGNFHGTTLGPGLCWRGSCGAVFKFSHRDTGWVFTPLYRFRGGSDGSSPHAGVTVAPDGSLYGTTIAGGGGSCDYGALPGCGTVYQLRPPPTRCASVLCPWSDTVIYSFQNGSYLASPYAAVTLDQSGNVYGTALSQATGYEGGVFELSRSQGGWNYSLLFGFDGSDGGEPYGAVIFDQAGNIYGTTSGNVFKLSHSGAGWIESVLVPLGQAYPYAGLISDSAGNLYGTTAGGGQYDDGSVFELSPVNGGYLFSVLYSQFISHYGVDRGPFAKLVMDRAGNLYGTQYGGGAYEDGMVFKLTPASGGWTFTDVHDFTGSDGANPLGDLVLDENGNLFGTAQSGGTGGSGVIWEITP